MMDTGFFGNISISGEMTLSSLLSFEMRCHANRHVVVRLKGIVDDDFVTDWFRRQTWKKPVQIFQKDHAKPIFSGLIKEMHVSEVNGYFELESELVSSTYLLDTQRKSRSFQQTGMTYEEIISKVLQETEGADFNMESGKEKRIEIPIIQYKETDWEFLLRLASHCGTSLIPDPAALHPRFWFGPQRKNTGATFPEHDYTAAFDQKYYELGGKGAGYEREDFSYYIVSDTRAYDIGDRMRFKGQERMICDKTAEIKRGELIYTYKLGFPQLLDQKMRYNTQFNGLSLPGKVLRTERETLKLHLDIDKEQDAETAYSYNWTPSSGNLFYLMPEPGTRVSLYFGSEDETSGKVINCIRTNGGGQCPAMGDYNNRCLTSVGYGKQMYFMPDKAGFNGTASGGAPLVTSLDDEKGIAVLSHKEISIVAQDKIVLKAPDISMEARTELMMAQAHGTKNLSPNAGIGLADRFDVLGGKSKLLGSKNGSAPPTDEDTGVSSDFERLGQSVLAGIAMLSSPQNTNTVSSAALASLPIGLR